MEGCELVNKFSVSVDLEANAAYVAMSDEAVVATREASPEVLVDLDQFGMVVGVEFLRVDAEIPFERLTQDFHIHSDVVERLRDWRPSIATRLTAHAEGTTATKRSGKFLPA